MSLGMPVTVEERDVDRSRRGPSETNFAAKMYFYGRELCFILALLFTSYAALQNVPPKVSKSPVAVPFFPRTSLVADFYQGQLSPAFERVSESDISFVMYYAPWDAECQSTRTQFKAVAHYYYKQVYFAAINCWQPLSECRQQFAKIQHFPVLIAYTQHTKGIQYKGIKEAAHMIKFLQFVLRPLERIEHSADLINLMASHDAVVVGMFNFSGNVGGPGFHAFYSTALKFLERDPHREVGFAVVTNQRAAAQLGVFHLPAVRLYMWNETLEYSQDTELSVDYLVKWVSHNTHQVSVWVTPPGVKSLTLSPYVEDGSVLVLFTPRNPLHQHVHYYDLLREVGLEYYDCDDNPWVNELAQYLSKSRTERKEMQRELESDCLIWKEQLEAERDIPPVHVVRSHWINDSCCQTLRKRKKLCGVCEQEHHPSESSCCWVASDPLVQPVFVPDAEGCETLTPASIVHQPYMSFGPFSETSQAYHTCCKPSVEMRNENLTASVTNPGLRTSMLTSEGDDRSAPSLLVASSREKCQRWHQSQLVHKAVFPHTAYHRKTPRNFHGLACQTNKTLSLLAMDSLLFHQFAEGLGVDIFARNDKTAVIIFNAVQESAYVLDVELSKGALLDFMVNYTDGILNRSLRSSAKDRRGALNQYPEVDVNNCHQKENSVCIQELTSKTFHHVVMDRKQAVILLYHTPYCAFCHGISHIYLMAARYFRAIHNLTFARIDGENNDLPWEFTMHHYPTILFFPAHRKSESRVFPQHLPITVPNLVNFVLANLGPGMGHLQGMVALCSGWEKGQDNALAKDCIDRVRHECLQIISDTLSQYRTTNLKWLIFHNSSKSSAVLPTYRRILHRQTKDLLIKLQHLKEIHFVLGSTNRLENGSAEYKVIQRSFQVYYNSVRRNNEDLVTDTRQQGSIIKKKYPKDEL